MEGKFAFGEKSNPHVGFLPSERDPRDTDDADIHPPQVLPSEGELEGVSEGLSPHYDRLVDPVHHVRLFLPFKPLKRCDRY
jgi:hypothetical protein